MKTRWIKITIPIIFIFGLYFLGPQAAKPDYNKTLPEVPSSQAMLENYILKNDQKHKLKPGNEAKIVWADSAGKKTEYAIVYLHGFSASEKEGDPVHRRLAKNFGCNLFLSRLSDHGVDTTEALLFFTVDRAWNSAKEALAIGGQLGEKVILVSTSTGGTLALMLAANYPDRVHGLINLSPNIALANPAAFLLNGPWGLQIARMVMDGKYYVTESTEEESIYWNATYRLEALVQLQELIESSMTPETFHAVTQPSLTLYYYKNETEQDPHVKVSEMLQMNSQLATPESLKVIHAMPEARAHVIGSSMVSKDVEGVYGEMEKFAVEKLKLQKSNGLAFDQ